MNAVNPASNNNGQRVLLLAPTVKDGVTSGRILAEAAIECTVCPGLTNLCNELSLGAAVAILAEEAMASVDMTWFIKIIAEQAPWSDFPVLVLAQHGADSPVSRYAVQSLGNVILLERPVRVNTLISAVRAALRARNRQYQLRDYLSAQQQTEQALRAAEQALREAHRRKDEFLATLAHELRNPLAPIRNAVEVLRMHDYRGPEERWCREVIERQIAHVTRLIDDLLDISRITHNTLDLRKERVTLQSVVNAAIEVSRPLAEQNDQRLTVTLPATTVYLNADQVRLAQALTNIVNNAIKYTGHGGQISLSAECQGTDVIISVKDNGNGIGAEKLPFIFDMFYQIERSADGTGGGLGIGLALVRQLVAMHGGTVEAFSNGVGKGSEFTLRLPLLAGVDATPPVVEAPAHNSANNAPRRVLVVDDNRDAADALSTMLRLLGHEVGTEYNGMDALQRAEKLRPEVILLDIGMPGLNGYEVIKRLREHAWGRAIFIAALTGWGQQEDLEKSRNAGFDCHLVKPVAIKSVVGVLAQLGQGSGSPPPPTHYENSKAIN